MRYSSKAAWSSASVSAPKRARALATPPIRHKRNRHRKRPAATAAATKSVVADAATVATPTATATDPPPLQRGGGARSTCRSSRICSRGLAIGAAHEQRVAAAAAAGGGGRWRLRRKSSAAALGLVFDRRMSLAQRGGRGCVVGKCATATAATPTPRWGQRKAGLSKCDLARGARGGSACGVRRNAAAVVTTAALAVALRLVGLGLCDLAGGASLMMKARPRQQRPAPRRANSSRRWASPTWRADRAARVSTARGDPRRRLRRRR